MLDNRIYLGMGREFKLLGSLKVTDFQRKTKILDS